MYKKEYPRIIFFGTPEFAVANLQALVENGFNVVAVVTAPDKPAGRGMQLKHSAVKEYALAKGLPLLQPEKLKALGFISQLKNLNADLQVVVAFRMLPEVVWNMPPMGTINVHASLLPQYRGAAPINWAIINGETKTGVTTFKLKQVIDTGNILLQEETNILPDDNIGTLYDKLMHRGAALLVKTVNGLMNNTIEEQPQQVHEHLHHAPKIHKETGLIHWQNDVVNVHNLIRGLSPYPGAYTTFENKQLKVFVSHYELIDTQTPIGNYQTDGKTFLRFAAKDGWLYCQEVQWEGKKRMKIEDFLRGLHLK